MRDLDDVDATHGQTGNSTLLFLPKVTQQGDRERRAARIHPDINAESHARLVTTQSTPALRPLYPPAEGPERALITARNLLHRNSGIDERPTIALIVSSRDRPDQCCFRAFEHSLKPTDMVEVEVGEHEQRDAVDSHHPQTRLESLWHRSGVDEQHSGVAAQ